MVYAVWDAGLWAKTLSNTNPLLVLGEELKWKIHEIPQFQSSPSITMPVPCTALRPSHTRAHIVASGHFCVARHLSLRLLASAVFVSSFFIRLFDFLLNSPTVPLNTPGAADTNIYYFQWNKTVNEYRAHDSSQFTATHTHIHTQRRFHPQESKWNAWPKRLRESQCLSTHSCHKWNGRKMAEDEQIEIDVIIFEERPGTFAECRPANAIYE